MESQALRREGEEMRGSGNDVKKPSQYSKVRSRVWSFRVDVVTVLQRRDFVRVFEV